MTSERPDVVDPGSTNPAPDRLRRAPDFGPSGYLPPRAAKRARKILLREPLGLQWAAAAVIAGLLVLTAGGLLVLRMSGPPGAPFVPVGNLAAVDPRGAATMPTASWGDVLVLRATGGVRAFAPPGRPVVWCPQSRRLESDDAVWEPDGQLVGGRALSLEPLPVEVHDGRIYVDPTMPGESLPERPEVGATPACPR